MEGPNIAAASVIVPVLESVGSVHAAMLGLAEASAGVVPSLRMTPVARLFICRLFQNVWPQLRW
ncbi:hypothetical protein [Halobacterium bonnevillei]|uniref:Uncharacterized protein n=1 Tax=Halobacterium bonnevillei TaxID=2692200 RepID=A0A6B0SKM6_9EURY|nr:hypothetical protein [Halobacterium bonnevillei]MXR19430.1 hypothetical protein [Halobacterium bonnevillei]